jgi:hypothetical protein
MAAADQKENPPNFRIPVVRHFVACERIDTSADRKQYSLVDVIHVIKPLPDAQPAYPRIHPSLWLFVQMSDGRGSHTFRIQLVFDGDKSTYASSPVILDLGNDPLTVHGWPIHLKNLLFQRPGLYEFLLLCDEQVIATESIVLREVP